MAAKKKKKPEASAEKKILDAARKLFTEKGYDAVKTRDIAKTAGINIALLNYYFRSKHKLFEIIMLENLVHFFQGVSIIVNNEDTGFYKKIELLVEFYTTRLMANPHVPLFILNEARKDPKKLPMQFRLADSFFMKQFHAEIKAGRIKKTSPSHLMTNILGLTVFPFAARPIIQMVRSMSDKEYELLMLERKILVPQWIKSMLELKK